MQKNKDELSRILIQDQYEVAILSETWSKIELEKTKYKITNYHTYLNSRVDGYGGAAILIDKKYKSREIQIPRFDHIQCLAREILSIDIVVVSIYISPSISTNDMNNSLKQIFDKIKGFRKVVFGGDFNSHHLAWDPNNSDRKGAVVMDLVNEYNFLLLNQGQATFIPVELNKRPSAIDLVLATPAIYQDLNMTVLDYGIGGSRHLALSTIYVGKANKPTGYFINQKKVKEELGKLQIGDIENINDLQAKVKTITKNATQKNKHIPKHWWSDEVEQAWLKKKEARAAFNRRSGIPELIEFKKAECNFNRIKKKYSEESFEKFVKSIDPSTPSKIIWNDIRRLAGRKRKTKENVLVHEDRSLAQQFLDKHFPYEEASSIENLQYQNFNEILTREKWDNFLQRKKRSSAPGPDGISYETMKTLPDEIQNLMIRELNDIWKTGRFPVDLKSIKIIAIPKPGKNPELVEGTRPLSMINCTLKTLNAAVLVDYQEHLDKHHLLPELSFGFRKKMSTNTCLNFVVNEILGIKRRNKVAAVIFIDLSNAFNTVQLNKLELVLANQDTPRQFVNYISAFLKDRNLRFQVGTDTVTRTVSNGLPQGDILSPTLFNVYTSNLHQIQVQGVVLVQYADDFAVIVEGKNIEEVQLKGQEFMDKFVEKAQELNFTLNANKTKSIIFQANNKDLGVTVNGEVVETVRNHKYLGVTLDKSLSFGCHIRDLKQRTTERLNMIKVISGIKTGGHPEVMDMIYKALVRNFFEYGTAIYSIACQSNLNSLDTLNNQCLRKVTGCTKSTPLNTLQAIAAQDPPQFRRLLIAGKELINLRYNNSVVWHQLRDNLEERAVSKKSTYLEKTLLEHEEIFNNMSTVVPSSASWNSVEIKNMLHEEVWIKKNTSTKVLKQLTLGLIHGKYTGRQIIYTDASKCEETCGVGIYHEQGNFRLSLRLQNSVSIMSAELEAIYIALQYISRNQIMDAVIMTDSKSGCEFLLSAKDENPRDEVAEKILKTASETRTSIQWIPGHVDVAGNEVADHLAKSALNKDSTANNKILKHDAVNYFLQLTELRAQEWYVNYTSENGKGRKFFALQNTIPRKPWHHGIGLENGEVRTLNRIFAGHDYSKHGLFRMKLAEDCLCDLCDEIEDAKHLILFCIKYLNIREKYDLDKYNSLQEIYATKNVNVLKNVTRFLKEIKKVL